MKDKSNSDEKAAREHGQQHRIVWRNSRRGAKGAWFNPQAESIFEKAVWEWQWLEQDLFMKISLLEFFFIGRLYLQSFSIGRCLHSSHSGYMGVGIWHRWSTGEKLAPRRYHLLSIICDSLAIFAPTRIFTSIHITYCVIDRSLEVGFTAGFSTLKWGMDQILKT